MNFASWFANYKYTAVAMAGGLMTLCVACQPPTGNRLPAVSFSKSAIAIESLRQPQQVERSVPLSGSVIQRLAILNGWLYQIDDGTGQVWILTQQAAPAIGRQVHVKGVLRYEAIVINGADLGDYYLEETQRRLESPT
ncbi:MAG: hypothetical protein AAGA46_06090 [Cyanobacteria bacterium P01_F01_bin.13]